MEALINEQCEILTSCNSHLQLVNDDGQWVRLNVETILKYCNSCHSEAWCLLYNQHLGKMLLHQIDEPKSYASQPTKDLGPLKKIESNDE